MLAMLPEAQRSREMYDSTRAQHGDIILDYRNTTIKSNINSTTAARSSWALD